eukprot:g28968.t1
MQGYGGGSGWNALLRVCMDLMGQMTCFRTSWLIIQFQYPTPAFSRYPLIPLATRATCTFRLEYIKRLAPTAFCGRDSYNDKWTVEIGNEQRASKLYHCSG